MIQRVFNHEDPIIIARAMPADILSYLAGNNDDPDGIHHKVARHLVVDCAGKLLSGPALVIPDVRAWTTYDGKKYYIKQYGRAGQTVELVPVERKLGEPGHVRFEKLADCGEVSLRKYRDMADLHEDNQAVMMNLLQAIRLRNGVKELPTVADYGPSDNMLVELAYSSDMHPIAANMVPIYAIARGLAWSVTTAIGYKAHSPDDHVVCAYRYVKASSNASFTMELILLRAESIDRWGTSLHELGESWVDANGTLW